MEGFPGWIRRIYRSAEKGVDKAAGYVEHRVDVVATSAKEDVDEAINYVERKAKAAKKDMDKFAGSVEHRVDVAVTSAKEWAYDVLEDRQAYIHRLQSEVAQDINVPLAYREYSNLIMCKGMKDFIPSIEDGNDIAKGATVGLVNIAMSQYNGQFTEEQILPSDKMPFVQSPSMLNYWAKSKGCRVIDNESASDDCMVLTYYTPLAKSFLENTSTSMYDDNNRHFYSHCKSEVTTENGKIVINPELQYNSLTHSGLGDTSSVIAANGSDVFDVSGYRPEDTIVYEIDYQALGLSKEDVEASSLYVNADINILDPKIQNSIFRLEDAGYTPHEIVELYRKDIDLTYSENIDTLTTNKDCNLDNLQKKDNSYRYNLTNYNCAVKPVAPLVFANERKIRRQGLDNEQANQARVELGLPNIYDPERYARINNGFYRDFEASITSNFENQLKQDGLYDDYKKTEGYLELPTDLYYSLAAPYGAKGIAWCILEIEDIACEHAQNLLGVRDTDKGKAPEMRLSNLKTDLQIQEGEMYYNPLSFGQNMRFDYNLSERENAPQNETSSSEEFVPYPLRIDNNNER